MIGFGMLDDIAGGFLQDAEDCYLDRTGILLSWTSRCFSTFMPRQALSNSRKNHDKVAKDAEIVKRRGTQIHGNAAQLTEGILNL